jgi:hypothetical protein
MFLMKIVENGKKPSPPYGISERESCENVPYLVA